MKPEARDEFRSIVYGYMSRVRRGDSKLYFPDRLVQLHKVEPTPAEFQLIAAIAKPIQKLNRLEQISILQALTSSPDALMAQLINMARNGSVPGDLAETVRAIVTEMPPSSKLHGLGELIVKLKRENPERWRLVVFTGRLETQTTIQAFLENHGLKVGIINGTSGPRNQKTIARFRSTPPDCHVIVSTEAGSEGVNLQVANVLVNYDLPWNPMIVEQRIGRIQRLASEHASVGIFNIILHGTFEEYIVGRLMEKLQMASHAIGDIESLLEASGVNGEDENGPTSFDEKIRQLVIAALEGKDVETATLQEVQSIADAKSALEQEEENINAMLGGSEGAEYVGPRAPTLPGVIRSMEPRVFALTALKCLGAHITPQPADLYLVEENGGREYIRFEEGAGEGTRSTHYAPGTAGFLQLVGRVIATGIHDVEDIDQNPAKECEDPARLWVLTFGGTFKAVEIEEVRRCFKGTALVRVRATVAHDSYERLVEIPCSPDDHQKQEGRMWLGPVANTIEDPGTLGINTDRLAEDARLDGAISEFSRFYLERRAQEIQAAGGDERKKKKLEDEFTPRLDMTLVSLQGHLHRQLKVKVQYRFDADSEYSSMRTVTPHTGAWADVPELGLCARSGKTVPNTCLNQCQISGEKVLQHLLVRSEISSRFALPEHTVLCSLSGKRVLKDEAELSAVGGRMIASMFLKTSALSGKRAEPDHFGQCEITKADVLDVELATSDISGKRYRVDEQMCSIVSGKTGHKSEFLNCHETGQPLLVSEAEQCEVTSNYVRPGILEECAITKKRVLPLELERCAATGKRALRRLFVTSSLSEARILEDVAVGSATGKFCAPVEAKPCLWSGRKCHPKDLRICSLTNLSIHFEFLSTHFEFSKVGRYPCLEPLINLLNGTNRTADKSQLWEAIATKATAVLGKGRCRVIVATLSPDILHLAVCAEVRTLLGFRVRHAGMVYSIKDHSIVGRVAQGERSSEGWTKLD